MSGIQCPRCGREASGGGRFWRDGKPYCPTCGWNVDRVNTLGGKNQKVLAVYFVGIAIVLCLLGIYAGGSAAGSPNPHLGRFVAFAFVLAFLALISWHRSKSQKSMQGPGAMTAGSPSQNTFQAPSSAVSASFERLRMLGRPRAIRLKTSMRIFVAVYAILFGGVCYAVFLVANRRGASPNSPNSLPNVIWLAMFGLIWSLIAFSMFRSILRDRALLTDGEVAFGTVTSQSYAGGENRDSRIVYEFKDAAGRTISGKCSDRTRKLFEEMQTPIFYDPTNPDKNIALAGATYDLVD